MKWFLIGMAVFLGILITVITASDKVAEMAWEQIDEAEGDYRSEEFEDSKYDDEDKFAEDHRDFMLRRRKIAGFAMTMTEYQLATRMFDQILEMYSDTPLEDEKAYHFAQKEKLYLYEKTNKVKIGIEYAKTLIEDFPEHPFLEQIISSKNRLEIRKMNS